MITKSNLLISSLALLFLGFLAAYVIIKAANMQPSSHTTGLPDATTTALEQSILKTP